MKSQLEIFENKELQNQELREARVELAYLKAFNEFYRKKCFYEHGINVDELKLEFMESYQVSNEDIRFASDKAYLKDILDQVKNVYGDLQRQRKRNDSFFINKK